MTNDERNQQMEKIRLQIKKLQADEKELARRLAALRKADTEETHLELLRKQQAEPGEPQYPTVAGSSFAHDTGGGRRVIRSTNNLGG